MTDVNTFVFDKGYEYHWPQQNGSLFRQRFVGSLYNLKHDTSVYDSPMDFIQSVKIAVAAMLDDNDVRVSTSFVNQVMIEASDKFMVHIEMPQIRAQKMWEKQNFNIVMYYWGSLENIQTFSENFIENLKPSITPMLLWKYLSAGELETKEIFLQPARPLYRELYPWLTEEPDEYIQRFLDSDSGVIILRGEPGTGKTSFIQSMIWQSRKNAMLTYDEKLFHSDQMFVDFACGVAADILIMEDADAMLAPRKQDGNPVMTKFLNLGDGLIRFPGKKLIISANIVDDSEIDSALLRPGRCFDRPMFRRLSYAETQLAAQKSGIEVPPIEKNYSLAELFSYGIGGSVMTPKTGGGFGFCR